MKRNTILLASILIFISTAFSSCQAIADIFKAGVWVGILLVAVVIGIIFWLVSKTKK